MKKNLSANEILQELLDINEEFGKNGFPIYVFHNGERYPIVGMDTYHNYDSAKQVSGVHSVDLNTEYQKESKSRLQRIAEAKKVLSDEGYFTDNLWHIEDVTMRFECTPDEAMAVLDSALTNEATMEQIHYAIREAAELDELNPKNDD